MLKDKRNTTPKRYDLFLDLNYSNLTYNGKVEIDLESTSDVALDAENLTVTRVRAGESTANFRHKDGELIIETGPYKGIIEVDYSGEIKDSLVGLYKSDYNDSYLLSTQFEAANARKAFPCVDHPSYKAEFNLSIRLSKDLDAISNMPIDKVEEDGEKKIVTFQSTPKMSTYLLYIGVGKYDELKKKYRDVDLIVATRKGRSSRGAFALEVTDKAMKYYESYFDIKYPLPKVHLLSIPQFAAGAMENWGAITFRETAIESDENSSYLSKKRVAEVVTHELAHQWFGDLVTLEWWSDLWLNESFATFMSYKVRDAVYPDWMIWEDFVRMETTSAMSRDSILSTHPIEAKIESPEQIEEVFDDISYSKGANVLRMVEKYVGEENFRKGIKGYLESHKYGNASGEDLWSAIEQSSGKKVGKFAEKWIRQPGYPVLTVEPSNDKIKFTQERFLLEGDTPSTLWPIPINMDVNGEHKELLLEDKETSFQVSALKTLIINRDRTGFFRVHYKGDFNPVLKADLSPLDKWGIMSDAFAMLMASKLTFKEYSELLERFLDENDNLIVHEVSNQLSLLALLVKPIIAEKSKIFHRKHFKRLQHKTDELSKSLRATLASRLVMIDESFAEDLGSNFKEYDEVEPDMKETVAIAYARAYENYEVLLRQYRKSETDEDKMNLITALMSFRKPELVALTLGMGLSGEVKRQDVESMLLSSLGNPDSKEVVWLWIKTHLERLRDIYEGTGSVSRMLQSMIPILGVEKVSEFDDFFKQNMIPEAEMGIKAGLEKLRVYNKLATSLIK